MSDEPQANAIPPIEPTPPVAPPVPTLPPPPPPGYYAPVPPPPAAPPGYGPAQNNPYAYYAGPVQPQGLSVTSMVLGIVGVVFSLFYGFGFLPSLAAVITGHIARKRQPHARGMSLAGIITGYVGLAIAVLWIVGIVIIFAVLASNPDFGYTSNFGSATND